MTKHPIIRVTSFELLGQHQLRVLFDDQTQQIIDLEPILHGPLYGPLRDPSVFRRVRIDPEVHTLVWPNGADFDPATLHDWPQHGSQLAERARRWQKNEVAAG